MFVALENIVCTFKCLSLIAKNGKNLRFMKEKVLQSLSIRTIVNFSNWLFRRPAKERERAKQSKKRKKKDRNKKQQKSDQQICTYFWLQIWRLHWVGLTITFLDQFFFQISSYNFKEKFVMDVRNFTIMKRIFFIKKLVHSWTFLDAQASTKGIRVSHCKILIISFV